MNIIMNDCDAECHGGSFKKITLQERKKERQRIDDINNNAIKSCDFVLHLKSQSGSRIASSIEYGLLLEFLRLLLSILVRSLLFLHLALCLDHLKPLFVLYREHTYHDNSYATVIPGICETGSCKDIPK